VPEFTFHPPGAPSWVDLMSPDVDGSKTFYTAVFGWDAEDQFDDDGNRVYVMFRLDGKSVAGLGGQPPGMPPGMPAVWNSYVATDDVAATAAEVTDAGGTVVMPPMQVFDSGEMAIFTDPTGATFSVWRAIEHIGAEVGNEPDTYSWNELMTRDIDAALAFYTSVFGWSYEPQDMGPAGTYHVIAGGESGGLGGLMAMPPDVPEQVPNHWGVYFTVADVDATIQAITAGGGQIVNGPMDIPGVGRTATAHDPAGGNFNIMQPIMEPES
jgi:predicted enzyme related to lactoylglutathione lyase